MICPKCGADIGITFCPRYIAISEAQNGLSLFFSREIKKTINVFEKVHNCVSNKKQGEIFNTHSIKKELGWDDHTDNTYINQALGIMICQGEVRKIHIDNNTNPIDDVNKLQGKGYRYTRTYANACEHLHYTSNNKRKCDCPRNSFTHITAEKPNEA